MLDQFVREGIDSSFSKDNINLWAREICSDYISNKIPLNEKIAQIAEKNNLNHEQIQRVVEATNLAVDSQKKGSDFEVAKTASVLAVMKKAPEEQVEGSSLSDYLSPPCAKDSGHDLNELFGVKPQESGMPRKKIIQIKIIKLANSRERLDGHRINLSRQLAQQEKELVKTAKQCVLGDREDINDLYKMVCDYGHEKLANKYFPVINHVLIGQNVIEKTAFRAPETLISKDMNKQGIPEIKIINGNHAILKKFDTIKEIENDMNREGFVMVPDGKYHQTIISPKTSFLDIPVVIRVPIKIGRGSILNINPNSEGDVK